MLDKFKDQERGHCGWRTVKERVRVRTVKERAVERDESKGVAWDPMMYGLFHLLVLFLSERLDAIYSPCFSIHRRC